MTWQPIETAPKDQDSRILLWAQGWRTPEKGFWRKTEARWGWFGSWGVRAEKSNQPTHWQPLPEPPTT